MTLGHEASAVLCEAHSPQAFLKSGNPGFQTRLRAGVSPHWGAVSFFNTGQKRFPFISQVPPVWAGLWDQASDGGV